jgi:hypothetical protein
MSLSKEDFYLMKAGASSPVHTHQAWAGHFMNTCPETHKGVSPADKQACVVIDSFKTQSSVKE